MVKRISEIETIPVSLQSPVRMYEAAMKQAITTALRRFGIDDCGHSSMVDGWEWSCCSIQVELDGLCASLGMSGITYNLDFQAWCEKYEEED